MQGIFFSFEGIDGCGKTTMLEMTADWLRSLGCTVLQTREPGGSDLGQQFRHMLLDSNYGCVDETTETLMFMADRSRHVAEIIKPALERGEVVLCDRYTDSTLAYQGGGRGLSMETLALLNDFAVQGVMPQKTVLLHLPAEIGVSRVGEKRDRMEQEGQDFFRRVNAVYASLAAQEPERVCLIDASLPIPGVFAKIRGALEPVLRDRGLLHD